MKVIAQQVGFVIFDSAILVARFWQVPPNHPFFLEAFVSAFSQIIQLLEQSLIHVGEVKARFALHAFLELGGHSTKQIRKSIDWHEMVGHISFSSSHRSEPHLTTQTVWCGRSDQLILEGFFPPSVQAHTS